MKQILSIDPGLKGALAWLHYDGTLIEIEDMPVVDKRINASLLCKLLQAYGSIDAAVIETQQAFPKRPDGRGQGTASAFKTGVGYGILLGALASLDIPIEARSPAAWKRVLKLNQDKERSRRMAIDRWPGQAYLFSRVKDEGRAEAALLGYAWLLEQKGLVTREDKQALNTSHAPLRKRVIPRFGQRPGSTVEGKATPLG